MKQKHLVVIGGGAAGFFTAINAAAMRPGLKVTILEKSSKLLSKVSVSGGGRCNVTHACFDIEEMIRRYPRGMHFVRKAFHQFFTSDTIAWFLERGVKLKTESDGRMFPVTNTSSTIVECLLKEAALHHVEIVTNAGVSAIEAATGDDSTGFYVHITGREKTRADFVCIACGGYPKDVQFGWIKALGHTINAPLPSLFTFNMPGNAVTELMGVSVPTAVVKIKGTSLKEEGPLLITHWGMSGPVVLRLSAWGAKELSERHYHFEIAVNWLPQYTEHSLREEWNDLRLQYATQKMYSRNPFELPARLWQYLLDQAGVDKEQRWSSLPGKQQNELIRLLTMQEFEVKGKTTFKEEFVTCGGVALSEVDVNTMQSKKQPGIYFAGEVLDVDGITGGFNFQHAWTSGWIAAGGIGDKVISDK